MTAPRGLEYVEAEDVRRSPFRVAVTPLPSLLSSLRDAVGAGRNGTPEVWCDAIRRHLRGQDYETLAPFVNPGVTLVPDTLVALAEPPGESLVHAVERLLAAPTEVFEGELDECVRALGNDAWQDAARDPPRWMRRYVASLLRAWKGFAPLWGQAVPALELEVERVGSATALDAQLELLDGLLANGRVERGRWSLPCEFDEGRFRFPDEGVVLLPMLAGERSMLVACEGQTIGTIGYPIRPLLRLEPGDPPRAALEALLGVPRAQILRALGRTVTIGTLARELTTVPSAATHHVGALEAAGLVERERTGRHVAVRRTPRGEALLRLYDELDRGRGVPPPGRRPLRPVPTPRELAS